jgi:acyl-CoA synthetase (AMP-forming)/AMP-acid ligase II
MVHATHEPFKRPCFDPRTLPDISVDEDDISSLPDLIRFNAKYNPSHVFCLQAETTNSSQHAQDRSRRHYTASSITFKVLQEAVASCSHWIAENILHSFTGDHPTDNKPIALFLESDVGLFLYLAALLSLNVPVRNPLIALPWPKLTSQILLISARLSIASIQHLLKSTGAAALLVSPRTRRSIDESLEQLAVIHTVEPYHVFVSDTRRALKEDHLVAPIRNYEKKGAGSLILHSSGTTGYPKPIYLSHKYVLGYAACHQFNASQTTSWVNLSTLPLYHGFGLLAPCLSLSVGLTTCFPPSSIIPAVRLFRVSGLIYCLTRNINCYILHHL